MTYRRSPLRLRRNLYPLRPSPSVQFSESDNIKDIPLPNEEEKSILPSSDDQNSDRLAPINILGFKLHIDEIIIIGLIFLLLQDKIDDEFLLLILAYVLIR